MLALAENNPVILNYSDGTLTATPATDIIELNIDTLQFLAYFIRISSFC